MKHAFGLCAVVALLAGARGRAAQEVQAPAAPAGGYAIAPEPADAAGATRWTAENPAQSLRASFAADEVSVAPLGHPSASPLVSFRLIAWGRAGQLAPAAPARIEVDGARIEYLRGPLTEWYQNDARGLEQGFTIAAPPDARDAAAPIELRLELGGRLVPGLAADRSALVLRDDCGAPRLSYTGLAAWDASGRPCAARLELSARALAILIDADQAAFPITVDPILAAAGPKLVASDAEPGAAFGSAIALWDATAIAGARLDDKVSATNSGAAYVFVRSGASWTEQAKLVALDPFAGDEFGFAVAVWVDTAIVGAPKAPIGTKTGAGAAYVFVRSGTAWTQQAKLVPSDSASSDGFGTSVAIWADTAVVGSKLDVHAGGSGGTLGEGSAYVFARSGTTWTEQAKLVSSDAAPGDNFGESAAIFGDLVLVGAPWDDFGGFENAGSAYVFARSGTVWTEQAKLTASDASGFERTGDTVALWGTTAVLGTPLDDHPFGGPYNAGAVYTFVSSGASWSQEGRLVASDADVADTFGSSVAIFGETLVAGAAGDDHLGLADFGSAYVFWRNAGAWTEQDKVVAFDAAANDKLGGGVAMWGDWALVGADGDDHAGGNDAGSAYAFRILDCPVALPAAEVVRVGTPPNPAALLPGVTSAPVLGSTWDPVVDHASFLPSAFADVLALAVLPANLPSPFGTILCDVSTPPFLLTKPAGVAFALAIPADCALVGATACVQAASTDAVAIELTNALDVTIGTF